MCAYAILKALMTGYAVINHLFSQANICLYFSEPIKKRLWGYNVISHLFLLLNSSKATLILVITVVQRMCANTFLKPIIKGSEATMISTI